MNWYLIVALGAPIATMLVGFLVGARITERSYSSQVRELGRVSGFDRSLLLHTLRRELANYLIHKDGKRFKLLYSKLKEEVNGYGSVKKEDLKIFLRALEIKYPHYQDFDSICTKDYIPYEDSMRSGTFEDWGNAYCDIVKFQALSALIDISWPKGAADDGGTVEHLAEQIRRISDTRLEAHIIAAMEQYHLVRAINQDYIVDTPSYQISRLPHFVESRYGVFVKSIGEYGIYSVFSDDREYISYMRSDSNYKEEIPLDSFLID